MRFLCFSLIFLSDSVIVTRLQIETNFVLFTFAYETFIFFQSYIGFADVLRYAITVALILSYLRSQVTQIIKWNADRQSAPQPIILRYWQSISKLASFIWPSNNVRLQLCLVCCAVLLVLGRITALLAPVYGKKVGMFSRSTVL